MDVIRSNDILLQIMFRDEDDYANVVCQGKPGFGAEHILEIVVVYFKGYHM